MLSKLYILNFEQTKAFNVEILLQLYSGFKSLRCIVLRSFVVWFVVTCRKGIVVELFLSIKNQEEILSYESLY